ncbi:hypothetical protein [Shewanella surugensis]|uniref:Uncharacterized protein n=1 Tax=Shewanella surugensis TaxID=212020 RepID=A0ABT0LBL4_9GAMM|nr:hypothetical protein [Shewanella surugensis]MCL1124566.1 hypothetical protein [Shewanella surugensis]
MKSMDYTLSGSVSSLVLVWVYYRVSVYCQIKAVLLPFYGAIFSCYSFDLW